jgi:tryptophan halogenase
MTKNKTILIVGGGSAGWMVASYLSTQTNCKITLVESANVPIIGVGESTIPSINDFIESVGLTEQDLFDGCSAVRKYTIQHNNWNGDDSSWWHHFCFDEDQHQEQMSWMQAQQLPDKKWRHAYHLDATKLGILLRDRVAVPRGVTHIYDDVIEVKHDHQGVTAVVGKQASYTADLYIDCTGFRSLLRKPLGVEYLQHPGLINNYALAGPGEFAEPRVNYTQTYAMDHGWRWRVCIQHRTGNGYAFNKDLISIDQAREEFIKKTPGLIQDKIFEVPMFNSFNPEPWKHNVVALGLSCGFLEPLEATGLFLVHAPLKLLARLLDDTNSAEKYNRVWRKMYNHIADFLSMHFTTSRLDHTEYWRSIPKITQVELPVKGQILFDQYSYRQLAQGRGLPTTHD